MTEMRVSPTLTLSFKSQPAWTETRLEPLQLGGTESPALCLEPRLAVFPSENDSGAASANFAPCGHTGTRETSGRPQNADPQARHSGRVRMFNSDLHFW